MTADVTPSTLASIAESSTHLPFDDTADFDDVAAGFIATRGNRQITAADGRVVWDLDAYAFLDEPCPPTAHPSLWRQGQLLKVDGLFEVVPGIYQVRGFDLSNITFVESDNGVIVIDPLISVETAAAALELYRSERGDRPVTGMIYTHSHIDHFGGVLGVMTTEDATSGRIPVIAPEGFMEHAISENIYAGPAMARRASYMYGAALTKGPDGQIGVGLGQTVSTGQTTLIEPTVTIATTGEELTVDGVRLIFQLTPGAEAPSEMNFYFPDFKALCAAENASHTLHNIVTLRGAQVRDARAWSAYLTETIALWGEDLDVVFASHHWPTWGRERAVAYLEAQRDVYAYLHDQTLRLMNQGLTGPEIADAIEIPPALEATWSVHGYYGSVSHNVKGIYQRYLGWYDGNPSNLWKHAPEEAAVRYMAAMGGLDGAMTVARQAFDDGDYRWAVEVLNHIIFSGLADDAARQLQASALEQLGFGAENGTWRAEFLTAAQELRSGIVGTPTSAGGAGMLGALSVEQILSAIAIRIDGPRAWDLHLLISFEITDEQAYYNAELRNGAFIHQRADSPLPGATVLRLSRPTLISLLTQQLDLEAALADGSLVIDGDAGVLVSLVGCTSPHDPDFAIVTP